jgi:cytochrome P450
MGATTIIDGPGFSYDPFSRSVMENPLPYYQILRDHYPVYRLDRYDAWAVSRFADVFAVLSDPERRLASAEGTIIGRRQLERHNNGTIRQPTLDPAESLNTLPSPVYEQVRQAMGRPLRPRAVTRLAEFIRAQARQVLDSLLDRGDRSFDLTAEYGGVVAARTVCQLVGLPLAAAPDVLDMVNRAALQDPEQGGPPESYAELVDRLRSMVQAPIRARRGAGADGELPMVDGLVRYRLHGRELTDDEVATQLRAVMAGGTETVPKVVAHGLWELSRNPRQLSEVRRDLDQTVPIGFDEMLRYCAPAQWFIRTVSEPITVGGQEFRRGERIFPLIMSANRDEREFDRPDEFIWNRRPSRHLAFGQGRKHCPGSHLARLEGQILVTEFLRKVPRFQVDESAAVRPPSNFQWGWSRLPVHVG